jgi:hypothetical protein
MGRLLIYISLYVLVLVSVADKEGIAVLRDKTYHVEESA